MILNLTKKENPFKVNNFMIGQFVTLNDENTVTVAGSHQFITPHRGFSLKLLNLRTLCELTTVHTRVDYLSLDDINSFELGTNDLWNNLTDLNRLNRQTFKQGDSKRKLQLIHPEPEGEQDGEVEHGLGLGREDDVEVDSDDIDLLNRYDEDDTGEQLGGPETKK